MQISSAVPKINYCPKGLKESDDQKKFNNNNNKQDLTSSGKTDFLLTNHNKQHNCTIHSKCLLNINLIKFIFMNSAKCHTILPNTEYHLNTWNIFSVV